MQYLDTSKLYKHDFDLFDTKSPINDQIKPLRDTEFFWVDHRLQLDEILPWLYAELKEKPILAVDLEFAHADRNAKTGEGSDWVIVAIIQASTFKTDYIFDCYNLREEIRT